jgi:hypothetical protein
LGGKNKVASTGAPDGQLLNPGNNSGGIESKTDDAVERKSRIFNNFKSLQGTRII